LEGDDSEEKRNSRKNTRKKKKERISSKSGINASRGLEKRTNRVGKKKANLVIGGKASTGSETPRAVWGRQGGRRLSGPSPRVGQGGGKVRKKKQVLKKGATLF